jgi:hypothetical protein
VALAAVQGEKTLAEITPVDVHFSAMTAAMSLIKLYSESPTQGGRRNDAGKQRQ